MSNLAERLRSYAKDQGGWHKIDETCDDAAARIEALENMVGQAYQFAGAVLDYAGLFGHPEGQRAMDYFSGAEFAEDFSPWPRVDLPNAGGIEALVAENARLREAHARIMSDRPFVIGWNDGFDHALKTTIALRFPTMLRKMWSGGEVQKWIEEKISEARAALEGRQ